MEAEIFGIDRAALLKATLKLNPSKGIPR